MTPAINLLTQQKIAHDVLQYEHDPSASSYGLEAAEKLCLNTEQVFKTLVAEIDGDALVCAIVPVITQLNLKSLAKAAKGKKAKMAQPQKVERTTGYVLGGVSPLGQKRALPTFLDEQALVFDKIYVSAGKRGVEVAISPADLLNSTNGKVASLT